ncbi:phosphopantetheine-binding protein [Streptomyces sp. SCL15-4]|uniref:phosphopantetheine-binding protein n=1 Tax=Streptomyces sp. SCL15-4 TaxID=2967221 RepID=UPI0029665429|nr:phosphopantetheine-binding protein [Streptomyces sp. SCL15-4]
MSETLSRGPKAGSTEEVQQLTLEWVAELLEDPQAGPDDNFLDLGGHSMLALQLSQRAKDRFGAEYDIKVLFEGSIAEAGADLAARTTIS